MKTAIGYKVLFRRGDGRLTSQYDGKGPDGRPFYGHTQTGRKPWTIGKWETCEGVIAPCANGFHCWENAEQERYVKWTGLTSSCVIAMVEFDADDCVRVTDGYEPKVASRSMRILLVKPLIYRLDDTDNEIIRRSIAQFYK